MTAAPRSPLKNPSAKSPYLQTSAIIMLFFGFAAGLPILLIFSSLSLWLREAGIDRATVTMFGWAALGYSFKFIWSPLVDSLPVPFLSKQLGRRRAWIFLAQLGIILAIVLMAITNPADQQAVGLMAFFAVLLGFSSATQDIVIDAYRIESAPITMQPVLSAMYAAGYRIGMIVSGAGALYLADFFGSTEAAYNYTAWQNTYLIMAAIMGTGLLTTLTAPEATSIQNDIAQKKQATTIKVMKWYAIIALLPLTGVGILSLGTSILVHIFSLSLILPDWVNSFILSYAVAASLVMPVMFFWLIARQIAPIPAASAPTNAENTEVPLQRHQHVHLFFTFLLAVMGFIAGFVLTGKGIPETDSVLLGFFGEVLRLVVGLIFAGVVAFALIKLKFINKQSVRQAWISPITDFFQRYHGKKALLLLALIGLYRISDIVLGMISNVFYQDMDFTKTDIANAGKIVGVIMTLLGGFLGGIVALRVSIIRAMMMGALLSCTTNLLFVILSQHAGDLPFLYLTVTLDNLAAGFASTIFIAFLSALTSIRFTAMQYALFSSMMTLFPKVLGGYSGAIVNATSYPAFFIMTFVIGLPVLYLIYLVGKHFDLQQTQVQLQK